MRFVREGWTCRLNVVIEGLVGVWAVAAMGRMCG